MGQSLSNFLMNIYKRIEFKFEFYWRHFFFRKQLKENKLENIFGISWDHFFQISSSNRRKNQINKFGNTSDNNKKDIFFTNLLKNKKAENFVVRRERSILSAMINNLSLLKQNDEILAKVRLSNSDLEELRDKIIDFVS